MAHRAVRLRKVAEANLFPQTFRPFGQVRRLLPPRQETCLSQIHEALHIAPPKSPSPGVPHTTTVSYHPDFAKETALECAEVARQCKGPHATRAPSNHTSTCGLNTHCTIPGQNPAAILQHATGDTRFTAVGHIPQIPQIPKRQRLLVPGRPNAALQTKREQNHARTSEHVHLMRLWAERLPDPLHGPARDAPPIMLQSSMIGPFFSGGGGWDPSNPPPTADHCTSCHATVMYSRKWPWN